MNTEYLTVREAATKLKVSDSTIRNLFRDGRLKGFRLGKLIRIQADSLVMNDRQPKRRRVVKDYLPEFN